MNIRFLCAGYPRLGMPVPDELAQRLYGVAVEAGPGWAEDADLDDFVRQVARVVTSVDHLPGTPIVFPEATTAMSFPGNFAEAYDVPFEAFAASDLLVTGDWPLDWNTAAFVSGYAFQAIAEELYWIAFPTVALDELPSQEERSETLAALLDAQVIAKSLLRFLSTAYRGKDGQPFAPGGEVDPRVLAVTIEVIEALFDHWPAMRLAALASAGSGMAVGPVAHLLALLEREMLLARYALAATKETTTPSTGFLDHWRDFYLNDARYDAIFGDDEALLFERFQAATQVNL